MQAVIAAHSFHVDNVVTVDGDANYRYMKDVRFYESKQIC